MLMLTFGTEACLSFRWPSNIKEEVTETFPRHREGTAAVKVKTVIWAVFKDTVGGRYHREQMVLGSCEKDLEVNTEETQSI